MKKTILSLVLAFVSVFAFGQNALNDKADSILGDYSSTQGGAQYKVVLFDGLQYNAQDKTWGGTKIYDPQRGINAKVTASFEKDGTLKLRGTVLGIGESAYWKRIK